MRAWSGVLFSAVVLGGLLWAGRFIVGSTKALALTVTVQPRQIMADGESTALVSVRSTHDARPTVSFEGSSRGAVIESIEDDSGVWQARIRAGVLPGLVRVRIDAPGYKSATAQFNTEPDARDTAADGTPDFLRLNDDLDEQAFRNWFVWLAEAEYFQPPARRPAEIDDCAALIRFAYRGALQLHDSAWANSSGLTQLPSFDSPAKYHYPLTPLGASLFRVRPGPFQATDLNDGAFRQFADAQTLWRFNTGLVSRSVSRALPGDLLFFRRSTNPATFHTMIYVGESKVRPDGHRYLLYHTGPTGSGPSLDAGEIRRPTVEELMRFPQPEWRPVPSNPAFLGVMRWNILRGPVNESEAPAR